MKFLVLVLFLFVNLVAKDDYSFRVGYGLSTQSDFLNVLYGDIEDSIVDSSIVSLDAGYLLEDSFNDWPLDIYLKAGFYTINEGGGIRKSFVYKSQTVHEESIYLKGYWNFDFLQNRVRFGFGEGVSYVSSIPNVEKYEADKEHDNNSYFLNYIDFSLDVDLGKLIKYKPLEGTSLGWVLQHRSGIFGLINAVKHGGSNYNTFYVETKF